jgi:GNAT superfamily N-acetyltransferase
MNARQVCVCAAVATTLIAVVWHHWDARTVVPLSVQVVVFDADRHGEALRECLIALQDEERRLVPHMPTGAAIVDAALRELLVGSHIRVAVSSDAAVLGYVAFCDDKASLIDGSEALVRINDLFVRESVRGRSVGRALLASADAYAREHNIHVQRIEALANNERAIRLYCKMGFAPRTIEFEKKSGHSSPQSNISING